MDGQSLKKHTGPGTQPVPTSEKENMQSVVMHQAKYLTVLPTNRVDLPPTENDLVHPITVRNTANKTKRKGFLFAKNCRPWPVPTGAWELLAVGRRDGRANGRLTHTTRRGRSLDKVRLHMKQRCQNCCG